MELDVRQLAVMIPPSKLRERDDASGVMRVWGHSADTDGFYARKLCQICCQPPEIEDRGIAPLWERE